MRTMRGFTLTAIAAGLVLLAGTSELRAQQSGVQLWGRTCSRCHNTRPLNERTDREWATIVNHMRARANLTRSDARAILEFLQAANPSEAGRLSRAAPRTSGTGELTADESRLPTPEEDAAEPGRAGAEPSGASDRASEQARRVRELIAAYLQRAILSVAPPR